MTYLLDTHVWLWHMLGTPQMTQQCRSLIDSAQKTASVYVPVFAVWEIAQKESSGRITLHDGLDSLIARSFGPDKLKLAELGVEILLLANRLPGTVHGDPADRIIIATAVHHGYTLLTHDQNILNYSKQGHLRAHAV